ncbi:MAG TPA: MotA/TolQ/ExbB proton channel family protein [bacterium]|nr:MotA/TolQ/ExbB proton channel family protein [bacterium]
MIQFFMKGGPLMWPLLAVSLATVTVALERLWFILREGRSRRPADVEAFFTKLEKGQWDAAQAAGKGSTDFAARALAYGLENRATSFSGAYLQAAARELARFSRGLALLDTAITLAPLMGLLGTVTGLIRSFGLLGDSELQAPAALTGGIAEALIATAFGLVIAITALIPFNFLNARLEAARREMEDAGTRAELLIQKAGK